MGYMFYVNSGTEDKITSLDLSNFDTENVTDFSHMFENRKALVNLNLSGFKGTNATNITNMLTGLTGLTTLNIQNFNTPKITSLDNFFGDLNALTSLDLSGWDTRNVTSLYQTFYRCRKLNSLDLSSWNVLKVVSMNRTFTGTVNLKSLDLSGWDTRNVTNMQDMFNGLGSDYSGTTERLQTVVKMWVPSTFVATAVTDNAKKPFNTSARGYSVVGGVKYGGVDVYTDAASGTAQGWGTIHSTFKMHYGATHDDFLNA
jgi:surface protein